MGRPVDEEEVWSVVCTYVAKSFRGQGVQHRLLGAGIDYARVPTRVVMRKALPL